MRKFCRVLFYVVNACLNHEANIVEEKRENLVLVIRFANKNIGICDCQAISH